MSTDQNGADAPLPASEFAELRSHLLAHSVKRGDFVLKSGRRSSWFIDSKQTVCRPEAMLLVADAVLSVVPPDATAIGGLTMGADPVAFVAAGVAATRGRLLNAFSVRKEAKDHGGGGRIAGALDPGDRVVITEDTVTRGTSLLEAAHAVRDAGAEPVLLVAVVDRGGTVGAMAAAEGLPFRALLTAPIWASTTRAPEPYRPRRPESSALSECGRMEPDGVLGAGHHAQPAGPAVVGVGGVGGLVAVGPNLEPGQATEGVEVGIVDPAHLEHVVGTHDDAVALALASGVVDHRSPGARGRGTPLTRTIRMSGGPSLLVQPDGVRRHRQRLRRGRLRPGPGRSCAWCRSGSRAPWRSARRSRLGPPA